MYRVYSILLAATFSGCLPFPAASLPAPAPIPAAPGVAGASPQPLPPASPKPVPNTGAPAPTQSAPVPSAGGQPANPSGPAPRADPGTAAVMFTQIQPALASYCSGGGCHSFGSQNGLDAATKAGIYQRLASGMMPPAGSPALSASDKQAILKYCSQ